MAQHVRAEDGLGGDGENGRPAVAGDGLDADLGTVQDFLGQQEPVEWLAAGVAPWSGDGVERVLQVGLVVHPVHRRAGVGVDRLGDQREPDPRGRLAGFRPVGGDGVCDVGDPGPVQRGADQVLAGSQAHRRWYRAGQAEGGGDVGGGLEVVVARGEHAVDPPPPGESA